MLTKMLRDRGRIQQQRKKELAKSSKSSSKDEGAQSRKVMRPQSGGTEGEEEVRMAANRSSPEKPPAVLAVLRSPEKPLAGGRQYAPMQKPRRIDNRSEVNSKCPVPAPVPVPMDSDQKTKVDPPKYRRSSDYLAEAARCTGPTEPPDEPQAQTQAQINDQLWVSLRNEALANGVPLQKVNMTLSTRELQQLISRQVVLRSDAAGNDFIHTVIGGEDVRFTPPSQSPCCEPTITQVPEIEISEPAFKLMELHRPRDDDAWDDDRPTALADHDAAAKPETLSEHNQHEVNGGDVTTVGSSVPRVRVCTLQPQRSRRWSTSYRAESIDQSLTS